MIKFKNIILAATALACMACSKEEMPAAGPAAISFDAVSAGTRAVQADLDAVKADGFHVYANSYSEGSSAKTPLFSNQLVSWNSGVWSYSPTKYWPASADAKVDFYAVYSDGSSNFKLLYDWYNRPQTVFYVNRDVKAQSDLLWAAPRCGVSAREYAQNGSTVSFVFEHALTAFFFTARLSETFAADYPGRDVQVDSIALRGYFAPKAEIVPTATNIGDALSLQGDWEERTYLLNEPGELSAESAAALTTAPCDITGEKGCIMLLPFAQDLSLTVYLKVRHTDEAGAPEHIYQITKDMSGLVLEAGTMVKVDLTLTQPGTLVRSAPAASGVDLLMNMHTSVW